MHYRYVWLLWSRFLGELTSNCTRVNWKCEWWGVTWKKNIVKQRKNEKFLANAQQKNIVIIIIVQHQVAIVANKFINESDKQQMGFGTNVRPEYPTQLKYENWITEMYAKSLSELWIHIRNSCKQ